VTRGRPLRAAAPWWLVAGAAAALSGCAGGLEGPYGTDPVAVARGAALAGQYCGSCHGLGPDGASNAAGAPPFRAMRFDYNAISYERGMADWSLGHVHMPPAQMSLKDVGAIGAYVRSLKRPGGR
jgi:mono/diheme cytochrome c family protein